MDFRNIDTIIFDFDGTLATCPYDFAHMRRAVLHAADAYGLPVAELAELGLLEIIERGADILAPDHSRAAAFRAEATRCLTDIEYEAAAITELLPGIIPALQTLKEAGFRLGVVTRNSTIAVQRIIGDAPLPIDALLCREDVRNPKPHTDHVIEVLRQLAGDPATALMVGDHPMDIEMGKAAGMRTVAVLTGQTGADRLQAANPDLLLPSVMEMVPLLLGRRHINL